MLNEHPIFLAARTGAVAELSSLLAEDPSLAFMSNSSCKTPLMMAAIEGSAVAIEILLPVSNPLAKCPITKLTALDLAVANGRVECSALLLNAIGWPAIASCPSFSDWPKDLMPLNISGGHLFSIAVQHSLPLDDPRPVAIAERHVKCLAELLARSPEPLSDDALGLLLAAAARCKNLLCFPALARAASANFFEIEALPGRNALGFFAESISPLKAPYVSVAFLELCDLYFQKARPRAARASALGAIAILEGSGFQNLAHQLSAKHERFEILLATQSVATSAPRSTSPRL